MHVATNRDCALAVWLCSSLLRTDLTACWPVEVYAYVGGDVKCSPHADEDFYQWEPQLAKAHVSPRAHGKVTDAGWIAEMGRHGKNGTHREIRLMHQLLNPGVSHVARGLGDDAQI